MDCVAFGYLARAVFALARQPVLVVRLRLACAAGQSSVIPLRPPSASGRCFNRGGRGGPGNVTELLPGGCGLPVRTSSIFWAIQAFMVYLRGGRGAVMTIRLGYY